MTDEPGSPQEIRAPHRWWKPDLRLIVIAVIALVIVAISVLLELHPGLFHGLMSDIESWVRGAGAWGGVVIIFLMIVHSFIFFPFELLAIVAGAVYGFWLGSLYMWIGSMLAAAMCFQIARMLGRPFVERQLKPAHRATLEKWTRNTGAVALLISRFLPIISFNIINYGAGLTSVSWWTFLWTTAVGIIPLILLSVLFGVGLDNLPLPLLLAVSAAAIAAILLVHHWAKKKGWIHH